MRSLIEIGGDGLNREAPLEALTGFITPVEQFFVRSHAAPEAFDPGAWRLEVDGLVNRPLTLSLADLEAFPRHEITCVLECAGNGRAHFRPRVPGIAWHHGAVGNATWEGVRVGEVLNAAGLDAAARHLHLFGGDLSSHEPPYERSIELAKAMDDCLIAFTMNGAPLTCDHGAPARLVVPGWTGNHWMKWLTRISAQRRALAGFYMDEAYRVPAAGTSGGSATGLTKPVTSLRVKSAITTHPRRAKVGERVTIRGFAFSGAPDVALVELTEDDGASWSPAELDPRHSPYAWRLWSYLWTPLAAGRVTIAVRATDVGGATQPRHASWNPGGYEYDAWPSVEIDVAD